MKDTTKKQFKLSSTALITALLLSFITTAQTGGQFSITQSVIAGGGADSTGAIFGINGTAAQPNAGDNSSGTTMTGGTFSVRSGFWQSSLVPSAALASVSGRVLTTTGIGIRNARLSLTNQTGATQTALTGTFGYFSFPEVAVGETYFLTVHSKRFQFTNGTIVLSVMENVNDLVFVADL